jgi:hypothetical protein
LAERHYTLFRPAIPQFTMGESGDTKADPANEHEGEG